MYLDVCFVVVKVCKFWKCSASADPVLMAKKQKSFLAAP